LDRLVGQLGAIRRTGSKTPNPPRLLAGSRWFAAPDIPPTAEVDLPELTVQFWMGMWVPKGTPKDVIGKLNTAVVAATADGAVRQQLRCLQLWRRRFNTLITPEALASFHKAEVEKWWPVIKAVRHQSAMSDRGVC